MTTVYAIPALPDPITPAAQIETPQDRALREHYAKYYGSHYGRIEHASPAAKPQTNTAPVVCHLETNTPIGPRRPTHAEAAAILDEAERQINARTAPQPAVCTPETPRRKRTSPAAKPDPSTAADRLAAVVTARKARTAAAKPRKEQNNWHVVRTGGNYAS